MSMPHTHSLSELAPRAAGRAWADLYDALRDENPALHGRFGLSHGLLDGVPYWMARNVDHVMLNRLCPMRPAAVRDADAVFRAADVPRYMLTLDADVLDETRAHAHGLDLERFPRPWASLLRVGGDAPEAPRLPVGLELREATREEGTEAAALFCDAFDLPARVAPLFAAATGRPGWRVAVVLDENAVVGVGMLHLDGERAYLFGGATRRSHRRRGVQGALVQWRIRQALEAGAHVISTETGVAVPGRPNSSWHNLERAGLRPGHVHEHLCPAGTTW